MRASSSIRGTWSRVPDLYLMDQRFHHSYSNASSPETPALYCQAHDIISLPCWTTRRAAETVLLFTTAFRTTSKSAIRTSETSRSLMRSNAL
ncbi:hypothetical protein NBEOAGPD_3286 [Methylobacterium gregans]|uniref:Uncharacterized protein n=1 Tax=Methylobacterium gregans TaxID=374424 RepID=A0AA37HQA3_9HYPH|nr:hypothetical protein NBEOAGPD_3286 [Methylobacterium gregans]